MNTLHTSSSKSWLCSKPTPSFGLTKVNQSFRLIEGEWIRENLGRNGRLLTVTFACVAADIDGRVLVGGVMRKAREPEGGMTAPLYDHLSVSEGHVPVGNMPPRRQELGRWRGEWIVRHDDISCVGGWFGTSRACSSEEACSSAAGFLFGALDGPVRSDVRWGSPRTSA